METSSPGDDVLPKPAASLMGSGKNAGFSCFPNRMPEFPGGNKNLIRYLATHISYPSEARTEGVEGTIVIYFFIQKDGSIHHVHAVGHMEDERLKKEAIRVVKNMPNWKPAIHVSSHEPVSTAFSLPIRFKLKGQDSGYYDTTNK